MGPLNESGRASSKILDKSTLLAMPPNCDTIVEEVGDELVLTRSRGWCPLGVVLLLILAFYTYMPIAIPLDAMGIAPLLPESLRGQPFHPRPSGKPINLRPLPSLRQWHASVWLFLTPYVVGWPFLIAWTAGNLTSFDQVRIGPGGVEHRRGTLLRRRRRSVPLNEVRSLDAEHHFLKPSRIQTWGRDIQLGDYWAGRRELEWLTDIVRRKLLDLKSRDQSSPTPSSPPTLAVSLVSHRVTFSTLHQEDPKTDWIDRISGFGGCLVPTLFINGWIVGYCLEFCTPFEWNQHWPLLFYFALCVFTAYVSMAIAYDEFTWQSWTFEADEVVAGHYFLGIPIGAKVRYATYLLGSVELKMMRREYLAYDHLQILESRTGEPYPLGPSDGLEFRGRDGKPLDTIHGLTPREALWLLRELSACWNGTLNTSETLLTLPPAPANSLWDREHDL